MQHLLRIGQVAREVGVSPKTLRYYEDVGLLTPAARSAAGYRLYTGAALERVSFIRRAQALGLPLRDIRRILRIRDEGEAPCEHILAAISMQLKEIDSQVDHLLALRSDLVALLSRLQQAMSQPMPNDVICPCLNDEAWLSQAATG